MQRYLQGGRRRCVLCVLVAALLTTASCAEEIEPVDSASPTTEPTTTTEDPGPEESKQTLALIGDYGLDGVPCEEVTLGAGELASIECDRSPVTYRLTRFEEEDELHERFEAEFVEAGLLPRPWWYEDNPEEVIGAMIALTEDGTSVVHWINDELQVFGSASQEGEDSLRALMRFWRSDRSVPDAPSALEEIAPGDCVSLPAEGASEDPFELGCDEIDATATVLSVHVGESDPTCPDTSDRTWSQEKTVGDLVVAYSLCLETIVDPLTDQELEILSCVEALPGQAEDEHDVEELPCQDPRVTHVVVATVPEGEECPPDASLAFSKSEAEIEATGEGVWCLIEHDPSQ